MFYFYLMWIIKREEMKILFVCAEKKRINVQAMKSRTDNNFITNNGRKTKISNQLQKGVQCPLKNVIKFHFDHKWLDRSCCAISKSFFVVWEITHESPVTHFGIKVCIIVENEGQEFNEGTDPYGQLMREFTSNKMCDF